MNIQEEKPQLFCMCDLGICICADILRTWWALMNADEMGRYVHKTNVWMLITLNAIQQCLRGAQQVLGYIFV